ncbi:hypothetical protein SK128_017673, partial [Halocaridina rubra]
MSDGRCRWFSDHNNAKDPLCTERPSQEDPECCVVYDCKKTDVPSVVPPLLREDRKPGQPLLLVTRETHNSFTLAWDDFRAKRHEGGYVIEYREADESVLTEERETESEGKPWMRKELPPVALNSSFIVEDLKPNTIYQVRVSIYGDNDDARLGDSTETVTVKTDPGCVYGNSSYAVGEFFVGCEERCMCLTSGDTKCFERCTIPYFRAGSFKDDPKCREQPTNRDDCCVTVQCFTTLNTTFSCENVVCGPNAKCIASNGFAVNEGDGFGDVTLGYCRCLEGFVGDASDLQVGCVEDLSADRKEGVCTFKSNRYNPGDVFYDGCDYKCTCTKSTEIECEPRCEFPYEAGSKTDPGCEYIPDPEDLCCKLHVCNSTSDAAVNAARAPSLISDGCTVDNVTYAKNETFYKECHIQCTCIGYGDVSCHTKQAVRCPPLKVVSNNSTLCATLPDPLNSCCSITVCDEETPDVMKTNMTDVEKEMKNMTDMQREMLMKRLNELEKEMMMRNVSDMKTILQHLIEKKNDLLNSNITEAEKELIKINMTENEMMLKDVSDMEEEIIQSTMTDMEKEVLKQRLMDMQQRMEEKIDGEIDDHTRMHLLGIEHSHKHDLESHTHTHDDGTTHTHRGGDLSHAHDEMSDHTHTHEDGTMHTHPAGHIPHTHDEVDKLLHTHEDGTTHSHPGGHLPHTHKDNETYTHIHEDGTEHTHRMDGLPLEHDSMHTHTHEDGTTHTHADGHLPHSHEGLDNATHTHEDGTTHTHPVGGFNHRHEELDGFSHTHEDGTTHRHSDGHLPHTHDDTESFTHTHEDGTTHSHPVVDFSHRHGDTENLTHTHEDGTTHSHPDGHLPHTHDETENFTHTHEDGTTHSHPGGHLPHTHDDAENFTHTHEDGTTHSHPPGHLPHTHDDTEDFTHTHEDGTTHSHPPGHLPHTHDDSKNFTHTHEDGTTHTHPGGHLPHTHDGTENFTHTHEDGTMHSHPSGHLPHSHDDIENFTHTHEDGTTHSHLGVHLSHTHDDSENFTHTHEDGTTHSHPPGHLPHTHDNSKNFTHTHEDGTTHTHPGGHLPHTHNDTENFTHTHEDGTTHSHPGGHLPHSHDDSINFTHTHEDGTTHSHPHMNDEHMHGHEDETMHDTHDHTHDMHNEHGHTHTHDETDHSHSHGDNMDDIRNFMHIHDDGTVHSHPHDHTHDTDNHTHTHEDGTTHSHPHSHAHEGETAESQTTAAGLEKKNRAEDLSTHDLNILNIVPVNATTVRIKVAVSDSVMTQLLSSENEQVKVFYSPDSLTWMGKNISISDIAVKHIGEMVLHISGLQPSTPYQFRISYRDHVSSTAKAQLLDGATDIGFVIEATSRPDCIAGTSFVEETICSRHCICGENNEVMCKPRCPMIALPEDLKTNCPLVPNPEDPCCKVPECLLNTFNNFANGTLYAAKSSADYLDDLKNPSEYEISDFDMHSKRVHINNTDHHIYWNKAYPEISNSSRDMVPETETKISALKTSVNDELTTDVSHFSVMSEASEQAIDNSAHGARVNAYLPTDDIHTHEDDHNLIYEPEAGHSHGSSSLRIQSSNSSVQSSGHDFGYLPGDDEVGSFPDGKDHVIPMHNSAEWNPSIPPFENVNNSTGYPFNSSVFGFVIQGHEESYLPKENENDFQEPREYHNPLHVSTGDSHHWEDVHGVSGTKHNPHLRASLSKEHTDTHRPTEDDEVIHKFVSSGETLFYPVTTTKKPDIIDEGHPLFSQVPLSSHNKADVTGLKIGFSASGIDIDPSVMCYHNGNYHKPGEEFYKDCTHSCICSTNLEVHCAAIECPVTFGLELVDPNCLEWDTDEDYVPTPPHCCPQLTCISSAACQYMDQKFNNYDVLPRELTGCSQVCTCNHGNVTCRDLCGDVPSHPPSDLNCAPEDAVRITLPGETCCETWQCAAHSVGGAPVVFPLPPESVLNGTPTSGFIPIHPSHIPLFGEDKLIPRPHITSLDSYTAQLIFSTPVQYQGLPGELVVRYTNDSMSHSNPESWMRKIIVPAGTRISNTKWEYKLHNLEPNTDYAMQLVMTVLQGDNVTSPIFYYTTLPEVSTVPTTTPLARLDIDAELHASEVTKTSAKISWRIFDDYELQYIDGVQVKYTAKDKLIPNFSLMFHRNNDQTILSDLQPGNTYTVDLVFLTNKNQQTQVSNTHPITFDTLPEEDPYSFDIIVTAGKVSSQTAELFYSGVPEPEEKYVNVYRAVYLKEVERIDAQTFKIPKTGQEKKIFLSELKPDVDYQVWLEAYLSNGRKKKSNVISIRTRAGQLPKPEKSETDRSVSDENETDRYYPALVAVAIIAAIACIGFLGLLVILLKKQSHAKAHINSSRNNAAYDNPSYKVGDNASSRRASRSARPGVGRGSRPVRRGRLPAWPPVPRGPSCLGWGRTSG